MVEKGPNKPRSEKLIRWIRDTATIFAISLVLTNCTSSPEERYQRQQQKVQDLEYRLKQLQENYYNVSTQWEIQENLKKNWADPTINQEIWYSIQRTKDQDKEISKTKEKLAIAQRDLARMKEEIDFRNSRTTVEHSEKPNPHKYDYIPKEFERNRAAQ